jgi:hypothetical protein
MRLPSPDLLRNFAFGFALGALMVAGLNAHGFTGDLSSAAHAEPAAERLQPASEFAIPAEKSR